jgi:molybdenum cofactor cytidylyltransferase
MIAAIVLAAGRGSRMGRVKPLLSIDGEQSLDRVLRSLSEAGISRPIVVLGHAADAVRAAVDLTGCQVVLNLRPSDGLSSSLRLGLQAVPGTAIGALILHADMPLVRAETICAVAEAAAQGATIAAPRYRGVRGFPVFLARRCFDDLAAGLAGDSGARAYIERHLEEVRFIDVEDPACVIDIDRPEDLEHLERRSACTTSG